MAFNITVLDKAGNIVDWNTLDAEVCELWGVPQDKEHWGHAPGESYSDDWHEFLGHCVFLHRAYDSSNKTYLASDFFKGLLDFGTWRSTLDDIQKNKYEIQLLLFWIAKEYQFKVENRW